MSGVIYIEGVPGPNVMTAAYNSMGLLGLTASTRTTSLSSNSSASSPPNQIKIGSYNFNLIKSPPNVKSGYSIYQLDTTNLGLTIPTAPITIDNKDILTFSTKTLNSDGSDSTIEYYIISNPNLSNLPSNLGPPITLISMNTDGTYPSSNIIKSPSPNSLYVFTVGGTEYYLVLTPTNSNS